MADLKKSVSNLTSGEVLNRSVEISGGQILFSSGQQLSIRDIERLKNWDVDWVWVSPGHQDDGSRSGANANQTRTPAVSPS